MTEAPTFFRRAADKANWRSADTLPPALLTGRRSTARELRLQHFDEAGAELPLPLWAKHAQVELQALVDLPERWDGRRARPVAPRAVEAVVQLLAGVMTDELVRPQYFPLADGGVQVEWHAGGHHMEIEVDPTGGAHLLITEPDSVDVEVDMPAGALVGLIEQLQPSLQRLTDRVTAGA